MAMKVQDKEGPAPKRKKAAGKPAPTKPSVKAKTSAKPKKPVIVKAPIASARRPGRIAVARPAAGESAALVSNIRRELGVTQELFARMVGVTSRSIAGWEAGAAVNESSLRRIREMERLAASLKKVMKPGFMATWLVTPNEGMGGISPVEALQRGENDRLWRSVFLMGSGLPV
ncbi:MAG: helix-turn-helix domain-containing protein [Isosphaeraceae bacterium]|nr:helix-turn-helix domain-containing protein [Isosphaeraceae bacterium]